MSEEDIRKIINHMQAKSCEQDAISTKILKEILDGVLPTLIRILMYHSNKVCLQKPGKSL